MIFGQSSDLVRLKWAFESCKNGAWGDEPDGENDAICIRAADFDGDLGALVDTERTLRAIDEVTIRKAGLRSGDLIVEKSGGGEKQLVGRSVIYEGIDRAVCSNFLARCRPNPSVNSRYLNYLMLGIYLARGTYPHIKQTTGIQNLDMASFLNTRVSIPSLSVQCRVAAFLDEKTAQIDALIVRKKALLERLAEKRQAIITRAVTKGLDLSAPMKDSSIEWLGQIPAHWAVRPLRYAVDNLNRMRIPIAAELRKGIERLYPYYGASGIIDYVDEYIFDFPTVLVAEDGANLLSRSTPLAFTASGQYWVNNHAHILRPTALTIWFCSAQLALYPLDPHISGSAQPKLTKDNLMSLQVWVPPIDEQSQIEENVSARLNLLDPIIGKCNHSIGWLFEYRSALITAAVTGQIKGLQ